MGETKEWSEVLPKSTSNVFPEIELLQNVTRPVLQPKQFSFLGRGIRNPPGREITDLGSGLSNPTITGKKTKSTFW